MAKKKPQIEQSEKARKTTESEIAAARALVNKARDEHGSQVLLNIKPIAFEADLVDGYDPSDEASLFAPSVEIRPVVNPLLNAMLLLFGFERTSDHSYRIGISKDTEARMFPLILRMIPETSFCADPDRMDRAHRQGLRKTFSVNLTHEARKLLKDTPLEKIVSDTSEIEGAIGNSNQHFTTYNTYYAWEPWREASGVYLSSSKTQLYLRVVSCGADSRTDETPGQLLFWEDSPNFNTLPREGGARRPVRLSPAEAIAALRVMREQEYPILPGKGISAIKKSLGERVMALPVPGAPGLGRLLVPESKAELVAKKGLELTPLAPKDSEGAYTTPSEYMSYTATAAEIEGLRAKMKDLEIVSDPRLNDVIRMAAAKPNGKRDPLRPYQDAAVALHTETDYGFVQASSPGLGKTVMLLQGMRERAAAKASKP